MKLFLVLLLLCPSFSWAQYNFKNLKQCFVLTETTLKGRQKKGRKENSTFVTTISNTSGSRVDRPIDEAHEINALIYRSPAKGQRIKVHIIQDFKGDNDNRYKLLPQRISNHWFKQTPNIRQTFTFPKSSDSLGCDRSNPQSAITVGATCKTLDEKDCSSIWALDIGLSQSSHNGFCPMKLSPVAVIGQYTKREDLEEAEATTVVEKAIIDRLTYLLSVISEKGLEHSKENLKAALLSPDGYCHKILQTPLAKVSRLANDILCHTTTDNQKECLSGDPFHIPEDIPSNEQIDPETPMVNTFDNDIEA